MADESLTEQLDRQKRTVSYDVYDMTVQQLVDMVSTNVINIAPDYQRHFVWDLDRESELVESIYLGIPVPSLYMAANRDGTWEVVDGVQRLSTLIHFCGDAAAVTQVGKDSSLKLKDLEKLTSFNGKRFADLPRSAQLNFSLRPVRVTTLNDKSDFSVRYDLFERLNTGGVKLHPQEIRNCVFRGKLQEQIKSLAASADFVSALKLPSNEQQSAIYEECVLRFFAYLDGYTTFDHSVTDFLNDYMVDHGESGVDQGKVNLFNRTMAWLRQSLPNGIVRGTRTTTPLNLYEAVAVGTALALTADPNIPIRDISGVVGSDEMKRLTTGATNSRKMVVGRIESMRAAVAG